MELEQLRQFVAAAEAKSISAAARELYISHSTVSRTLSSLEAELSVKLVERSRNSFTLTEQGERILPEAKKLIEQADAIKRLAESLS